MSFLVIALPRDLVGKPIHVFVGFLFRVVDQFRDRLAVTRIPVLVSSLNEHYNNVKQVFKNRCGIVTEL